MGTKSLLGVKLVGHGINHTPPSNTKIKERVPSWQAIGQTLLPFLFFIFILGIWFSTRQAKTKETSRKHNIADRPRQQKEIAHVTREKQYFESEPRNI
jgi:hypothetical protein